MIFLLFGFLIFRPISKNTENQYLSLCLNVLKYIIYKVLKMLFHIMAYLMRNFSLFLENVCEQFETLGNAEHVVDQLIQNR